MKPHAQARLLKFLWAEELYGKNDELVLDNYRMRAFGGLREEIILGCLAKRDPDLFGEQRGNLFFDREGIVLRDALMIRALCKNSFLPKANGSKISIGVKFCFG